MAAAIGVGAYAAERPWQEIRGRNVLVFGQQSSGTLRDIAIQIEQFRFVLGRVIGGAVQTQPVPTEVYLFDNLRAMQPYEPLYRGRPATLSGFCHCGSPDESSVIVASLSNYAESSSIVYHEYTHLLLRNAVTSVPVWLNEGLAEFFSTFTLDAKAQSAQVGAALPRHLAALRDEFVPLTQLLDVDRTSPLYNEQTRRSVFYAESWALTHYLLAGRPGGVETIKAFLADYADGADSATALVRATGLPLKTIERDLRGYVNQPLNLAAATGFSAMTLTLTDAVEVDAPASARPLAPADAEARLGDIQLRVDRVDEGTRRIEQAAEAAPNVAQAQLVLARLRLRQQRNDEALALLERAAARAPDDFATQYLYGLTLLRDLGDPADARWPSQRAAQARAALARAVGARPESPAALAWLGYAIEETGTGLADAREAIRKALALAPGRLYYALQLAEIEAQMGNAAEARRLLRPLVQAADTSLAKRATEAMASIDRQPAASGPIAADAAAPRETLDLRRRAFRLRETREGERRLFGELLEIACAPGSVRFRLRVDGREMSAAATHMEEIAMTSFGNSNAATVRCGPRAAADRVYVTLGPSGTVVAIEFMPNDYVP